MMRQGVLVFAVLALAAPLAIPACAAEQIRISLLLMAVDAQRDHLRISEALRISNSGADVRRTVDFALPPQAQYVTVHRGFPVVRETAGGFAGALHAKHGLTEVTYSYALPAGAREVISRRFPFPVDRMEIVIRGGGVRSEVMRGRSLPPLTIDGAALGRWEVTQIGAGESVRLGLIGLPTTARWMPVAVALGLLFILAGGLLGALARPHFRRSDRSIAV